MYQPFSPMYWKGQTRTEDFGYIYIFYKQLSNKKLCTENRMVSSFQVEFIP
jgi:hypothetical protein